MKERPILMCGEMVRSTLADRKLQTRRVMSIKAPLPAPHEILNNRADDWEMYGVKQQDGLPIACFNYKLANYWQNMAV